MDHDDLRMSVCGNNGDTMQSMILKLGVYWCLLGALCFLVLTGSSCRKRSREENSGQTAPKTITKAPAGHSAQEPNVMPALKEPSRVNEPASELRQKKTTSASTRKRNGRFARLLEEASKHPEAEVSVQQPSEQTEEPVKDPLAEWASAGDTDSKLEVLDDLEFSGASREDVIAIVGKALDDSAAEVRQAAVAMLEDSGEGTNPNTSGEMGTGDARVVELISRALTDESEDVRFEAMSAAEEQPVTDKLRIFDTAIRLPYDDVKLEAVSELSDMSSPAAMDVLINGLKDSKAEVREEVSSAIDFLVDQQFDNYEQAQKWWQANRSRYDENLNEKDDSN
jgi:hypothetical protein